MGQAKKFLCGRCLFIVAATGFSYDKHVGNEQRRKKQVLYSRLRDYDSKQNPRADLDSWSWCVLKFVVVQYSTHL